MSTTRMIGQSRGRGIPQEASEVSKPRRGLLYGANEIPRRGTAATIADALRREQCQAQMKERYSCMTRSDKAQLVDVFD